MLAHKLHHQRDRSRQTSRAEFVEWTTAKPHPKALGPLEIFECTVRVAIYFADVKNARVTVINSSGRELMSATLSDQFGEFVGVQMGSILIEAGGKASFASVGVGFNGDFNTVLGHFS